MQVIKTKSGQELLLPKNDYIFKLIFGDSRNKKILISFLRAILDLPDDEYELELLDPYLKPELESDKLGILDVRLKTTSGKIVDIEIQVAQVANLFERISFYKSKMIIEQIGKHDWYDAIKKVICIVITDYNLIKSDKKSKYHHRFVFKDSEDNAVFGEVEEIHTLELPKLPEKPDNSILWEWGQFIKAQDEEGLAMLAERNRTVGQAVDELYRLSADEEVRYQYEMREKAWRDAKAREAWVEKEGREKGRQEGRKEGRQEGLQEGREKSFDLVLQLVEKGYTPQQIKEAIAAQKSPAEL
jgi:predicted transposase/invertase (TIGR01784 family)